MRQAAREFDTAEPPLTSTQVKTHEQTDDLFSPVIRGAIREQVDEQSKRIEARMIERKRALAEQKRDERFRMAASAAGLGVFEWEVITRFGVWETLGCTT